MNTEILLLAEGNEVRVRQGFIEARSFIETSEQRFTRFSTESELSGMNRAAGMWWDASTDLFILMQEAQECHRQTIGLFDPSILPLLRKAGYTVSMDMLRGRDVPLQPIEENSVGRGFREIEMDPETHSIRIPKGMQIDLGGIAKGWIAEQAATILQRFSQACAVNAGGDMTLRGYPEGQTYWDVALEDPRDTSQVLAILHVLEGAVATSSVARRTWTQKGERQHHLIDPRTGVPADTRWLSVTVMAQRAVQAEAFAKAFLMAGEAETRQMRVENPALTVLGVDREGRLLPISEARKEYHVH